MTDPLPVQGQNKRGAGRVGELVGKCSTHTPHANIVTVLTVTGMSASTHKATVNILLHNSVWPPDAIVTESKPA